MSLRVEPGEPELNILTPAYLILKKLSQWIIYDTCLPELNNIKGKGENGIDYYIYPTTGFNNYCNKGAKRNDRMGNAKII